MLRTVLALVLAAHGIGHILFLAPLVGVTSWGQTAPAWLRPDMTLVRLIGAALWIAVLIGFGAAAVGLLGQQSWWRTAALIASIVSVIGLIVFWTNPVTGPTIAALIVNLLVVAALVIVNWPSVEAVGA